MLNQNMKMKKEKKLWHFIPPIMHLLHWIWCSRMIIAGFGHQSPGHGKEAVIKCGIMKNAWNIR